MSYSIGDKRCPRCGSRDIYVQDARNRKEVILACAECDYLFGTGQSFSRQPEGRQKRKGKRHGADRKRGGRDDDW